MPTKKIGKGQIFSVNYTLTPPYGYLTILNGRLSIGCAYSQKNVFFCVNLF